MDSKESLDLDLGSYLLTLSRRWKLISAIAASSIALAAWSTTFIKPTYIAEGKLLFKVDSTPVLAGVVSPNSEESNDLKPLVSTQNPLSTQIEVITSNPLLQKTIDRLRLRDSLGQPLSLKDLKSALDIKIVGGTDVIRIAYTSRKPEEAATVVNYLMKLYIENDVLAGRKVATDAQQLIDEQLPRNEKRVQEAEVALRRFKERNNVVALTEEATTAVQQMAGLDNQITEARSTLQDLTARISALQSQVNVTPQEAIVVSDLSQSKAVQDTLQELQKLDRELADKRSQFTDESPIVAKLLEKKAELEMLLSSEVKSVSGANPMPQQRLEAGPLRQDLIKELLLAETQRIGLVKRLTNLETTRQSYDRRVQVLPKLEQTQRELERRLNTAQATYEVFLKRLQELQVAANRNTGNAQIISPALIPEEPFETKRMLICVLGGIIGIFLGSTLVLLIEQQDKSLKSAKEVRALLGYPVLGMIPIQQKNSLKKYHSQPLSSDVLVKTNSWSPISEIYRMIHANLTLNNLDKAVKVMVVTSAVPHEGKSTIAANLAATVAALGHKVLLIDADTRKASQHYIWELSSTTGLSEVLAGKSEFNHVVSHVRNNLSVLPAGRVPVGSLAMLESVHMRNLIAKASEQYQVIIIDTPPLLVTADALTVGRLADGILLVARPGKLDAASAHSTKELLDTAHQSVTGIIINGVSHTGEMENQLRYAEEYFSQVQSSIEFSHIKTESMIHGS